MDPIIRLAQVSPVTRRIGRAAVAAPKHTVVEMAPAFDPSQLPSAPVAAPSAVPASAPVAAADAAPVNACACADKLARAEREHEAALARRDAEIDALRAAAQQAAIDLTDAYTDAERRGYEAGEKQGKQAATAAMRTEIDRVTSLAGEIDSALRKLTATAEDAMVDIVFTAVCRIIGERGATRTAVQDVVRAAAAAMREREQLVVRLHPDDVALLKGDADGGALRIDADPAVALGGCMIDGPTGSLDARFETQLEALGAALKSVRAQRLAGQEAA
jgi:flagellar biosynthesis/type III secretory pathway protein FliH